MQSALAFLEQAGSIPSGEARFRALMSQVDSVAVQGYRADGTTIFWNHASEALYGYSESEALGRNLIDLIIPPVMRDDVANAVASMCETLEPVAPAELRLKRKDGSAVDVYSSHAVIVNDGRCPELYCLDIDLTDLKKVVSDNLILVERMAREREMRREMDVSFSVIDRLAGFTDVELNLNSTLVLLVHELNKVFNSDDCFITRWDEKNETMIPLIGSGEWYDSYPSFVPVAGETTLSESVMRTRTVIAIEDTTDSPYLSKRIARFFGESSILGIPLLSGDRKIGTALVSWREPHRFSEEEIARAWKIAGPIGMMLSRAEAVEEERRAHGALMEAYDDTVKGWGTALGMRDAKTEEHSSRVIEQTLVLAEKMGIDMESLKHIKRGAFLHDVGKMAIPDSILLKNGPLDFNEWNVMRKHPEFAKKMLDPIAYLNPALVIPLMHHERWDGKGYPAGLKGNEIPLEARIFSVVDVWDALLSDRPYRTAMTEAQARQIIANESGNAFDPDVVKEFLALLDEDQTGNPGNTP